MANGPCEIMTPLQQLREHLIYEVFASAVTREPEFVAAIQRFGGEVHFVDGDLLFTLPELFRFLLADFEHSGRGLLDPTKCDYKAFRRLLYQGRVNTELRGLGAVVVVEHANDDHALSIYRLTRRLD